MMVAYFGFILLIAYNKPLLGQLLAPGEPAVGGRQVQPHRPGR